MMQHNPYDLIIIQQDVIPQKDIEELMLLTTSKEGVRQATVINRDDDGNNINKENLKGRNTLWYPIPEDQCSKLEVEISQMYHRFCVPKYHCEIKNYEPVQFLGYPVGGHYMEHNDAETFVDGKWTRLAERDVSFLFYLNSEFGGGELEFPELGLTIKPKKGMMIAFPSYKEYVHKVHPVTWGHRYTLVSWVGTKQKLYDTIPTEGV